jgi:hypothetical protein
MINIRQLGIDAQEAVVAEMEQSGRVPKIEFDSAANIQEMIGTDDGAREFVETVTYQAYSGREAVPLIYKDIYRTVSDPNFPKTMTAKEFGPVQVVFLKKLEGGEVKFGSLGAGTEKVVTFETWAAGLEYDEDIIEYNQTWRVSDIGVAFGEAYNKLLNHIHLYPIISGTYTTTGGGLAAQFAKQNDPVAGAAQLIAYDTSIAKTLTNALQVLPNGVIMLINSFDQLALEAALIGDMYADNSAGPAKRRLTMDNAIVYDGETVTVGNKTYTYGGVPQGFVFLLTPKRNFVEYIKHELRIDSDDGDLSRLILTQVVGRTRRAVLAGLSGADGAVKIDIAA